MRADLRSMSRKKGLKICHITSNHRELRESLTFVECLNVKVLCMEVL